MDGLIASQISFGFLCQCVFGFILFLAPGLGLIDSGLYHDWDLLLSSMS